MKKSKRKVWNILIAVFGLVFLGSAVGFATTALRGYREDQEFARLAQLVEEPESTAARPADREEPSVEMEPQRDVLQRQCVRAAKLNPDCVGWLRIPGTKVDYPVMHTPEDMQYYLRRDFYGNDSVSGTPFIGDRCDVNSRSMIIYGHNMKNGTMFGQLDRYSAESFWREHPVIELGTAGEQREYEIFGAFYTSLAAGAAQEFPYYEYVGELSEEVFQEFMEQLSRVRCYDTGIEPEYGDQIVMLSTCSYHTEEGRFVVVGRRKSVE